MTKSFGSLCSKEKGEGEGKEEGKEHCLETKSIHKDKDEKWQLANCT